MAEERRKGERRVTVAEIGTDEDGPWYLARTTSCQVSYEDDRRRAERRKGEK